MTATSTDAPAQLCTLRWGRVGRLALTAALAAGVFAGSVLWPYYANGLDALPLAEVTSGRYDPKDLWPYNTPGGGWLRFVGLLAMASTPMTLVFLALVAGALAVRGAVFAPRRRRSPAMATCLVVLAGACLLASSWFLGPTASALATWLLD